MKRFLIALALLIVACSCNNDPVPFMKKEYLIINTDDETTYQFATNDPSLVADAWIERTNCDLSPDNNYKFSIEGKTIKVQSLDTPKRVLWYYDALDRNPIEIKVTEGNRFETIKEGPYGSFVIEYNFYYNE